jgi:uncharacterized protein (DUF779 family)
MSEHEYVAHVTATPAARQAIAALRADRGPVMFVQSAGCCDGSTPMCYPLGEFVIGHGDLLLGEIGGCPFYMDARQYDALGRPRLVLDVEVGEPGGFSLAAGDGLHFTAGDDTTHTATPRTDQERQS